jgi:heme/copper-type cytochrome/quinol oxidase subunit 2
MSSRQRAVYLGIAAVIAVVAVIVLSSGGGDDEGDAEQAGSTPTATTTTTAAPAEDTPTATPTPRPTPTPAPLLTSGRVQELDATEGDTVRFRVRSSTPEHVHVHGYDLMADVVPGETTRMAFKATITGIFEIEFEGSGEQIGKLTVEPD